MADALDYIKDFLTIRSEHPVKELVAKARAAAGQLTAPLFDDQDPLIKMRHVMPPDIYPDPAEEGPGADSLQTVDDLARTFNLRPETLMPDLVKLKKAVTGLQH